MATKNKPLSKKSSAAPKTAPAQPEQPTPASEPTTQPEPQEPETTDGSSSSEVTDVNGVVQNDDEPQDAPEPSTDDDEAEAPDDEGDDPEDDSEEDAEGPQDGPEPVQGPGVTPKAYEDVDAPVSGQHGGEPDGYIIRWGEPITIKGHEVGNQTITDQAHYREKKLRGSNRVTYVLLYPAGFAIPTNTLTKKG